MDKKFMLLALKEAGKNFHKMHGGPFGACIVRGGKVIAVARNTVLKHDATCHAEVKAIRSASRRLKTFDLSGCEIYSTTEPCPMCFSAIHWARIGKIIYGTSIKDAKRIGFNELNVSNRHLKHHGKSKVRIVPEFMRKECLALLEAFDKLPNKKLY